MASGAATLGHPAHPAERAPALGAALAEAWREPERRPLLAGAAVALGLLAILFGSNLRHFAYTWSTDDNYSHGFLVPLLSLYFANEAARRGPLSVRRGVGAGLALLLAAILGRLVTIVVPIGIVGDVSFLLGLAGVACIFGGRDCLRRYGFALAFLVFMIPLPIALYSAIATPLQLLVSRVAAGLLNLGGIPVLRQGNMMTLPGDVHMFVAEACSGMRQMTGFLALSTAVAYLAPRPIWFRGLLVAASLPIAMTANVVRVVVTGLIMYFWNAKYAEGWWHTAEGLVMMALGLLLLGSFSSLLGALFPRSDDEAATGVEPAPVPFLGPAGSRRSGLRIGVGLGVLAAGVVAQAAVEQATQTTRPALHAPLASVPMRLGSWVGDDLPTDPEILRRSQADDHLNRSYEDVRSPGRKLTVWMNYSRHGLNLRHSPEVCLPSGGWEKVEAQTGVIEVERAGRTAQPITRLVYRQGELVHGIGFWYYIFGEGRVEQMVRNLPITSRSSHGRTTRGSGLTVEIFCPSEVDPDGEAIRDFAESLLAELEPLLPEERATYFRP